MADKLFHLNPVRLGGSNTPQPEPGRRQKPTFYNLLERVNQGLEREREANRSVRQRHQRCGEWTCLRPQCRPRRYEAAHVLNGVALDEDTPAWLKAA